MSKKIKNLKKIIIFQSVCSSEKLIEAASQLKFFSLKKKKSSIYCNYEQNDSVSLNDSSAPVFLFVSKPIAVFFFPPRGRLTARLCRTRTSRWQLHNIHNYYSKIETVATERATSSPAQSKWPRPLWFPKSQLKQINKSVSSPPLLEIYAWNPRFLRCLTRDFFLLFFFRTLIRRDRARAIIILTRSDGRTRGTPRRNGLFVRAFWSRWINWGGPTGEEHV